MKRIRTRHLIPYPPQQVWSVLTDFKAYAVWNPLNVWARVSGLVPMTFPAARIERQGAAYESVNMALEARVAEFSEGMVPRDGIEPPTP